MVSKSSERGKLYRQRAAEAGIVPSELDEVTGEPVVVQPEKGVGCKMDPETYRQVVLDMKNGVAMYKVAANHKVGTSALQLIRHRHADIIPSRSRQAVDRLHEVHEATSDLLLKLTTERKLPPGVVPIAFGIAFDKLSAALGTNVQKHEHIHAVLPQDDVKTALSSLRADDKPAVVSQKPQDSGEKPADAQVLHKKGDPDPPCVGAGEGGEGGLGSQPDATPTH